MGTLKSENIPQELTARPQWVCWCPDKTPVNPKTGGNAMANEPATWGIFEEAVGHYQAHQGNGVAGVGFEFSQADPYVGIDLDKCLDPDTGEIEAWAKSIIERLRSYTEISPSGRGVHIIVKGKLPAGGNRKGNVELYSHGRYFTMTGQLLEGTPTTIEDRQPELEALHRELFAKPKATSRDPGPSPTLSLSDQELIDKAHQAANGGKFARLWRGDVSEYGDDDSAADYALCLMLAFWTGKDRERMDRLFRQSGLIRKKWDRPTAGSTYGAITIGKAITNTTEIYNSGKEWQERGGGDTVNKPKLLVVDGGGQPGEDKAQEDPRGLRLSDWGNAERLVSLHAQDLRYCYPWEKWLVWDGRRWATDDTGEVNRRAKEVVGALYAEAALASEKVRRVIGDFAGKCEADAKQKAMISSARSEPGIPVLPDDLDRDPWLFNVLNGTIDLRTGELRPHQRGHLITKLAPVGHDPQAKCPTWWAFLEKILGGNGALIKYLQKAVGYALTGDTREQCLSFLYGLGANGKSTFLGVLLDLLGDYGKRTSTETFLVKKTGGIPNDVAALRGARLVTAIEAESGRRLAEVQVKEMTGGDTITARFLHAEFFTFKPEFKIFLAANHKPVIRGTDHAIWRRIRLVPFTVQIPSGEQDKELPEKLKAELPGILKWAVEGCLSWQHEGLNPPEAVQAATQEYREEMDLLADFLGECCIVAPNAKAKAGDLYKAYSEWAEGAGEKKPLSQTAFGLALTERGFGKKRGGGGSWCRHGIGLKAKG